MKILVFGTFDGLHPGHRFVLDAAAARGTLFVVVARDSTVEKLKAHMPLQTEEERQRAIAEAYPGATVLLGDAEDYLVPLRAVQPDLILLGYDQQLPPGVTSEDFPCPVERLPAFAPEQYKSSIARRQQQ